jgi:gliding motility-associated lipoprotein GldH
MSWERFDFVKSDIEINKATTYDLALSVSFDSTYTYDYLSVVFTVFDSYDNPLRTKAYQFRLKEKDGSWKSTPVDDSYHFSFPINSELTINEPGVYRFQLESRMPITPLYGIKEISIIRNN